MSNYYQTKQYDFGVYTDALLAVAVAKRIHIPEKLTKEERLLLALEDGHWHSARELAMTVSHRFGAYIFTLKKDGVVIEKRRNPAQPKGEVWWEYRLKPFYLQ